MTDNITLTVGVKLRKLIGFDSPRLVRMLELNVKSSSEISPLVVTLPKVQDAAELRRRQKVNSLSQVVKTVSQLEPPQSLLVGFR